MDITTDVREYDRPEEDTGDVIPGTSGTCQPRVERVSGRYPFVPACSCGWRHTWGYVAEHAAGDLAEAHRDGKV